MQYFEVVISKEETKSEEAQVLDTQYVWAENDYYAVLAVLQEKDYNVKTITDGQFSNCYKGHTDDGSIILFFVYIQGEEENHV